MKFKKGSMVEVFRRNDETRGSWFSATILLRHEEMYTVKYELFLGIRGKPVVEKVQSEDVRPHPPLDSRKGKWILGDVAEVFDHNCWMLGKIAKVVKKSNFVIRLFGSLQLKEFHISRLRVPYVWHKNRWVEIEKVAERSKNDQITEYGCPNSINARELVHQGHEARYEQICVASRSRRNHPGLSFSTRNSKNNLQSGYRMSSEYLVSETSKKRKVASENFGRPIKRSAHENSAAMNLSKDLDGDNYLHRFDNRRYIGVPGVHVVDSETANRIIGSSFLPVRVGEDTECSVASCSANDLEYSTHDSNQYSFGLTTLFTDNDMSSCSCETGNKCNSLLENELAANIHQLELKAYRSTVQALYASGPLSWEQESLLTNLRLFLNISNEEHLLQLRHMLST